VKANTVFVVDDEKLITDTLVAILQISGYNATAFYNADTALAECQAVCPEFVISDVIMPGATGVELAVQIERRCPTCKILLFSGNAGTVDLLEAARNEGYDFPLLMKPLHPDALLAKLDAMRRS
jgi:DNA-binding NtrC family response regulator